MFLKSFYRLMSPEGDGGAGGLGDGGTGGAGDGGQGGQGAGGNGNGDGGQGGAGAGGAGSDDGPVWAKDFQIDDDIRKDPSLKVFNDVPSLIKSYVHAQKQLGKKAANIPTENSTKEEWDQFHQKLGFELDGTKYAETASLGDQKLLGEQFGKDFLTKAHELRISSKAAKEMYNFFESQTKTTSEKYITDSQSKIQTELNALRDELGPEAYQAKLTKSAMFLEETVGKEFLTQLKDSGLGRNANLLKAFFTMSDKYFKEDNIPNGGSGSPMSISDIDKEINNLYANEDDAYNKPNHPDHKRRVDEVNKLFAKKAKLTAKD